MLKSQNRQSSLRRDGGGDGENRFQGAVPAAAQKT